MAQTSASRFATRLAFLQYALIGVGAVVFAPVLPRIIAEFDLSLAAAGLLFPAKAIGGFVGGLAAGPLIDRYGTKPIVLGCLAAAALGLLLAGYGPAWPLILAGFTLSDAGQRALSTCLNTLVAEANPHDPARYLNYLHGAYGVGALAAPLLIGLWLSKSAGWRPVFAAFALLWLAMALRAARADFPRLEQGVQQKPVLEGGLFKSRLFLALFAVAFCYNGVAVPLLGWISTYLEREDAVHPFWSASMISIFYLALTAGRFACGSLAQRLGFERTILACALGAAAAYPLVAAAKGPVALGVGVLFSGLFLSGLFPTALAIANKAFSDRPGTATAVLSTAMTLGALLPPWWTGAVADAWSFQGALLINGAMVAVMVAAAGSIFARRPKAAPTARPLPR